MMARRGALQILAAAGSALLTGCGLSGGNRYRYKLTVEVDTPEGVRTGYAVRQVDWAAGKQVTPEASTSSMTHKGEAVIVDLPNGQTLFALMSPDGQETPILAFGSARQTNSSDRSIKELIPPSSAGDYRGQAGYPRLVKFRDINNPVSVEKVDPANLAASFGVGYRLMRITAQIVDAPLTEEVAGRLEWLGQYHNLMLDGERYHNVQSPDLASHLNTLSFKRESI